MKTSNKLLIAFAALLIILPILAMAVFSKVFYTDAKSWADLEKQNETFDGKSENMEAVPLSQFNSIKIADGKEISFHIRLIKDEKFGVKFRKSEKDFVKFSVDKDGQLLINLMPKNKEYRYIDLFVYAPETNALSANNASTIQLNAKGDSLSLNLKKFNELRFDDATLLQKLSINAEDGYTNMEENAIAKSVYLNLKNAGFRSNKISYEDLSINSQGKSGIDVFGGNDVNKKYNIRNLTLKTTDSADVTFRAINIEKAKGSLSNQTTIQLPVSNLKQILK